MRKITFLKQWDGIERIRVHCNKITTEWHCTTQYMGGWGGVQAFSWGQRCMLFLVMVMTWKCWVPPASLCQLCRNSGILRSGFSLLPHFFVFRSVSFIYWPVKLCCPSPTKQFHVIRVYLSLFPTKGAQLMFFSTSSFFFSILWFAGLPVSMRTYGSFISFLNPKNHH